MVAEQTSTPEQQLDRVESGLREAAKAVFVRAHKLYKNIAARAAHLESKPLKVGSISDTPILVAPSAWLLAGLFLYSFGPLGVLIGVVSLLLHEFAHVFEARKHDIPTTHVIFHVAGAAANMEMNENNHFLLQPDAQWRVHIAGPLASILLAAVGYTMGTVFLLCGWDASIPVMIGGINLFVGGFNLLPFLPLDGGRILQGVLHKYVFITAPQRLNFAQSLVVIPSNWAWGLLFFHPFLTFFFLYLSRFRKEELQNTIGFLDWQIRLEKKQIEHDIAVLQLYAQGKWWKPLGLDEPPNSAEALKKAYKRATLANHPDRGGSADAMRNVREAYEIGLLRLGVT